MKIILSIFCRIEMSLGLYTMGSKCDFYLAAEKFKRTKMEDEKKLKALWIRGKQKLCG